MIAATDDGAPPAVGTLASDDARMLDPARRMGQRRTDAELRAATERGLARSNPLRPRSSAAAPAFSPAAAASALQWAKDPRPTARLTE